MPTKRKQGTIGWTVALAGIGAAVLFLYAFRGMWVPRTVSTPIVSSARVARHPLSGAWLDHEVEKPAVYGVMIENMVEARPQAGLDKAFLVIEAPVEAGIPRFIAFFSDDVPVDRLGPVRSARPYYVDWNAPFGGAYAHVGGSPATLDLLKYDDTIDLDEVSNEWFFWRDSARTAPHNVYTSIEKLRAGTERFASRFGSRPIAYETVPFKDAAPSSAQDIADVRIAFQGPAADEVGDAYTAVWAYDAGSGRYLRLQGSRPHLLEDGTRIAADNVVVMETDIETLDSVGRRSVRTMGEGDALLFQDGRKIEVRWKKSSRGSRLRFFDRATGAELALNAGSTWVEVTPSLK